jgi:hypothetical protein
MLIEIETEKGELVTPDPRQQIARPGRGLKPPGDRLEHTVTNGVAVVVIDPLEAIQIDHKERVRSSMSGRGDCRCESRLQLTPICEPRQGIVSRHRAQLPHLRSRHGAAHGVVSHIAQPAGGEGE